MRPGEETERTGRCGMSVLGRLVTARVIGARILISYIPASPRLSSLEAPRFIAAAILAPVRLAACRSGSSAIR